jgi:very-short-patch-repair endonuclease
MSPKKPPHPDATRPPSPARGEGCASYGERESPKTRLVSLGARSRRIKASQPGTAQPSPLAGEGGAQAPGEGEATRTAPVNKPRDIARKLRRNMTDAERKLWSILRNRKLTHMKFRRQVPIGPYVADFLCYEARLIVEADGGQHADAAHDAERDAWPASQGFHVLRFWNSDIFGNPEGVMTRLAERAPQQELAQ